MVLLCIIITIPSGVLDHLSIITNRAMIYFIGLLYGIRIIEKNNMNIWELLFYITTSIFSIGLIYYLTTHPILEKNSLKILAVIPITITLCIALSYFIDYLKKKNFILKGKFLGAYTLVIYTTHEAFQYIVRAICFHFNIYIKFVMNPYLYSLTIAIFTIIFSIIYTKISDYLLDDSKKKKVINKGILFYSIYHK